MSVPCTTVACVCGLGRMHKCLNKQQLGPVGESAGEEAGGTGNLCFSRVSGLGGILFCSPKEDFY